MSFIIYCVYRIIGLILLRFRLWHQAFPILLRLDTSQKKIGENVCKGPKNHTDLVHMYVYV
jgi:hypothetical protein